MTLVTISPPHIHNLLNNKSLRGIWHNASRPAALASNMLRPRVRKRSVRLAVRDDGIMMQVAKPPTGEWRRVLVATPTHARCGWFAELDELLAPQWIAMHRTGQRRDTVETIERGLADLAVISDATGSAALEMLSVIRAVERRLPCVLVAGEPTSNDLRRALALNAQSVVPAPVNAGRLAELLIRILGSRGN